MFEGRRGKGGGSGLVAGEATRLIQGDLIEAIDAIPEAFVVYDRDDRLLMCNRAFRELNADIADLIRPGAAFADLMAARAQRSGVEAELSSPRCGIDCGPRCADWRMCRMNVHSEPRGVMFETTADGRWVRVDEHRTASGLVVGLRTDLSDMRDAQVQLTRSEAKFRTLYAMAPVGIVRTTLDGEIRDANPTFAVIIGSSADDPRRFADLFDPRDRQAVAGDIALAAREGAYGPVERRVVGPDGGEITLLTQGTVVIDGTGTPSLWSFLQDISERKRVEDRIRHAAHHDGLTGLPNRSRLAVRLGESDGRSWGLLLIDLDNFKVVNDTLGHEAGDILLKGVAERLAATLRAGDFVARLGGDEFAVLLDGVETTEALAAFAERLFERLGEPIIHRDRIIRVGASIGMALAPLHAREPIELLRFADMALYEAKRSGRNRSALFTPALEEANRRRYDVVSTIRRALDEDRILPHYQPIVDLETGAVVGLEALARVAGGGGEGIEPAEIFRHPEIGCAVDLRMLERVGDDMVRLARGEGADLRVFLNVSEADFWREGLDERIIRALETRGLPASALGIEVTESVFISEGDRTLVPLLAGLRERGIALALDDFGTGFASLTHLKRLPVDRVKIDRSFVADIVFDPSSRAIVEALVRLGRALGKEIVAEGIETEAQRSTLIELGCRIGQGHLLGRPMAFATLEAALRGLREAESDVSVAARAAFA